MTTRSSFIPGAIWPDTDGAHINAHRGGMLGEPPEQSFDHLQRVCYASLTHESGRQTCLLSKCDPDVM